MKSKFAVLAAVSVAVIGAAPIGATTYDFSLTGTQAIHFQLDSSPTPSGAYGESFFDIDNVAGTIDGLASTFTVGFGASSYPVDFGVLYPTVGNGVYATGSQLYTGSTASPTFVTGSYALTNYVTGAAEHLTITNASAAAVPEPASWAMMIGGFGMVGAALRRRRRTAVSFG